MEFAAAVPIAGRRPIGLHELADNDTPQTLAARRSDRGVEQLDSRLREAGRRDDRWMIVHFGRERALLSNSLGRSDEAMTATQIALDHRAFGGSGAWGGP